VHDRAKAASSLAEFAENSSFSLAIIASSTELGGQKDRNYKVTSSSQCLGTKNYQKVNAFLVL
jgi:hypothetical protein